MRSRGPSQESEPTPAPKGLFPRATGADETLRKVEKRYRPLFTNHVDGVFMVIDGTFVCINQRLAEMTGYAREELLGRSPQEFVVPEERERAGQRIRELLQGGPEYRSEYSLLKKDGGVLPVEVRSYAIRFRGRPAMLSFLHDITERKKAEDALRGSEQRFRLLAENARDIVYRYRVTEPQGFEYVSPAVTAMTGYTPEECYADYELPLNVITHPDDREEVRRLIAEGALEHLTLRWVRKDGAVIWIEGRNAPVYDDAGNVVAMQGIIRDITERKNAEDALKLSEELNQALLRAIPDLVVRVRADGTILDFRTSPFVGTPAPANEVVGRNTYDVLPPQGAEEAMSHVRRALETGELQRYEYELPVRGETRHREARLVVSGEEEVVFIVRDITERKQAEHALRESEQRFRLLAEHAQDIIFRFRVAEPPGYEYMSPAITTLAGYTPEEYYAAPGIAAKIVHPDDRERFLRMVRERRAGPEELRWVAKDGTVRWGEQRNTYLYDDSGTLIAIEGIVRDITKRKQVEDALRASKLLLEKTFDSLDEMVLLVEPTSRTIIACNPAAERVSGYREEEMLGRNTEFLHVDRAMYEEFGRKLFPALDADGVFHTEYQARRKDGTVLATDHTVTAIVDDSGRRTGLVSVVRDITKRKQAEAELRESEERYRSTLDGMLEGIQLIGFDWRYLYVNDAVARHGRRVKDELLGHTMMEVYPGIEDTDLFGLLRRCMEQRIPHRMENEFAYPDGTRGWFELSIQPVPEGVCVLSLDITEQKRLEECLLRAREELEGKVEREMLQRNPYGLTFRELMVLHLVAAGRADKEIAGELVISPLTVHKHVANILHKMDAASRTEAGTRALREGLLD